MSCGCTPNRIACDEGLRLDHAVSAAGEMYVRMIGHPLPSVSNEAKAGLAEATRALAVHIAEAGEVSEDAIRAAETIALREGA